MSSAEPVTGSQLKESGSEISGGSAEAFTQALASCVQSSLERESSAMLLRYSAFSSPTHLFVPSIISVSAEDLRLISQLDSCLTSEYSGIADQAHALLAHMKFLASKREQYNHVCCHLSNASNASSHVYVFGGKMTECVFSIASFLPQVARWRRCWVMWTNLLQTSTA